MSAIQMRETNHGQQETAPDRSKRSKSDARADPNLGDHHKLQKSSTFLNNQLRILINSAFWIGLTPICWDGHINGARGTRSILLLIRWLATVSAIIIVAFLVGWTCASRVASTSLRDQFNDYESIAQLMITVFSALYVPFHVYNGVHYMGMATILNGAMKFWKEFSSTYMEPERKYKLEMVLGRILQFTYCGVFSTASVSTTAYAGSCKLHVLARLLPCCYKYDSSSSALWMIIFPVYFVALAFLQAFWTVSLGAACFVLIAILALSVTFSHEVLKQISSQNSQVPDHISNRTLRSLQVFSEWANSYLSPFISPYVVAMFFAIAIVELPSAIRIDNLVMKVGLVYGFVGCMIILFTFINFSGTTYNSWKQFVAFRKHSTRRAQNEYERKLLKSFANCASFRYKIGGFACLRKKATLIVLSIVIETICSILVLTA